MTTSAQPVTRVALVITELEMGGAERCLVQLACNLDRERYSVEVFSLADAPKNKTLIEQLSEHRIPVHFLQARGTWSFPWVLRRLRTRIAAQQPHVIQSFLFHANVMVSYLPRRPWRIFFGVRVADPRSWRSTLERWRTKRASSIVCVSQNVKQYLEHRRHFESAKLVVIPNAVDVAAFESARPMALKHLGIADERRVILFVGRLDQQKGIDWLLQAVQPVLHEQQDCQLVLAGQGDWSRYQHLARENNDRISWIGWQADIAGLLRRSHVLVLPSRWEGMPNVVLEAMAAGVPVLATSVEGVRELLGADAEPQTVRFGDSHTFAQKLIALLQDAQLRTHLIASNYRRVQSDFTIAAMVDAYQHIWTSP